MGIYIGTMASVPSPVQPLAAGCFIGREMKYTHLGLISWRIIQIESQMLHLLYVAMCSRPDLRFAASALARCMYH
jgi:hypothetical protein